VAREHIGSAEASDNNPTSGTFPIHANAQVGDFCLCSWYASAGGGATKTFVKPAALTDIVDSSSTSYGHLYVGWKFLDAADIAAGHAGSWSSGSQTQIGTCWGTSVWRGIDADTPLDGVAYTSATGTTRFSNPPAITPATSCSAVVSVIVATKIFSYKGVLLSANGYAESFGVDNNAVGQARLTVQYIHDRAAGRLEKPEIHAEDSVDYLWTAISIVLRDARTIDTYTETFTAAGAYTWEAPADTVMLLAEVWAGGGGGGGSAGSGYYGGGGGGGGAYANKLFLAPSGTYDIQVGAGGNGGAAGLNVGQAGGASYFENATSCMAAPGNGGSNGQSTAWKDGGAAASCYGVTKYSGGRGIGGSGISGGGGGGSGGPGATGNNGTVPTGATAVAGGGPGGDGSASGNGSPPASGPGGGGGGGDDSTKAGGNGYAGQVVLTWAIEPESVVWTDASVVINAGAASTDDNDVVLTLHAEATLDGSPVTIDKMCFSEDGVTWGEWENYATSRAYQLPAQDDEDPHTCTVYVKFRVTEGGTDYDSDAVSDSITLQIDWTDLSVYLEVVTLNDGMPVAGVTEVPLTFGGTSSAGDVVQYCYAIDGGAAVAWGTYVPDLSRPYHPMSITVELGTTGEHYVDVYLKDDDDNTLLIGRDDVLITDKTTIDYTRPFGVIPVRMYADSSQVRKMSHDIEAPNLLPVRIPTSAKRRR